MPLLNQTFLFQSNVSKKAGAFDLVICTGVFFNDEPEGEGIESSDICGADRARKDIKYSMDSEV